jgi:hypothetical protein
MIGEDKARDSLYGAQQTENSCQPRLRHQVMTINTISAMEANHVAATS